MINLTLEEIYKLRAQYYHIDFMRYCWQKPSTPFLIGLHTKEICRKIDKAIENYKNGKSTFLLTKVCFRHGKALEINTPIHTKDGIKCIKDIKVGDIIYGTNYKLVKVIAKSPIWRNRKLIKVNIKGIEDCIYCDYEHLWVLDGYKEPVKAKYLLDKTFYKTTDKHNKGFYLSFSKTEFTGDTVCIQVDSDDGIFLCGNDCIPTHNSDIVSRYLPAHYLGMFPDNEVMVVSYASSLSEGFSRFSRNIIKSSSFQELYPNVRLDPKNSGVQSWGIDKHLGICTASGLTSGLTGKGYHLGILDDYCASRADAESETMRNNAWEHFTDDFLTRRAPVSITIVLATPWHVDDIIGRIERKINPNSEEYDPNFPPFEVASFPAMNGEVEIYDEKNKENVKKHYDFLFPERFSADWYKQQAASLGVYGTASLMQCNPQVRGGNILNVENIRVHRSIDDFPKTKYVRVWDLAHSVKQRMKDDPDWTSGTLLAYVKKAGVYELWIKDVARIRAEAPERDMFINAVTEKDGSGVHIVVSKSIDSADMYTTMKNILKGKRIVHPVVPKGDKVARMSPVEPIFEAGNVHILSADWNLDWLKEMKEFPSGSHDDQVDNLSDGYTFFMKQSKANIAVVKGI